MSGCDTTFHLTFRALDFGAFLPLRFVEYGEEDDPPPGCDEIGNANLPLAEMQAKLAQFAAQLAGLRFTEMHAALGKEVNGTRHAVKVVGRERVEPRLNFQMNFDLAPLIHERSISPMR